MEWQQTLVLVKPDAVQRFLVGQVLGRLEAKGLRICALKVVNFSQKRAGEFYAVHRDESFFKDLTAFIASGPAVAAVLEGPDAVALTRRLVGPTDGREAPPGSIRGDLAIDLRRNVVHAADTVPHARREIELLFKPGEICSGRRVLDPWLGRVKD